jgi:hypothetical protein
MKIGFSFYHFSTVQYIVSGEPGDLWILSQQPLVVFPVDEKTDSERHWM